MAVNFSAKSSSNVTKVIPQDDVYNFKTCALFGVFSYFPISDSDVYKIYTSGEEVQNDFQEFISSSQTIRDNDRIAWLISAAKTFFNQIPRPTKLMICRIDPGAVDVSGLPAYREALDNIFNSAPPFYACSLVDTITYNDSNVGEFISEFVKDFDYACKKYDVRRTIFANCNDTNAFINLEATTDISLYNQSCNGKTNALDYDIDNVMTCAHSLNFPIGAGGGGTDVDQNGDPILPFDGTKVNFSTVNFAAAIMGAFFTDPFGKSLSSISLQGVSLDPLVTDDAYASMTYGTGNSSCLFTNVYASFSLHNRTDFAQVQYGTMASSNQSKTLFLDQVITVDYAQIRTRYDAAVYMISNKIYFDNAGIIALANVFKNVLQSMVNAGMIQTISNKDITYPLISNVTAANLASRTLANFSANVTLAVHIQKMKLQVYLNLT